MFCYLDCYQSKFSSKSFKLLLRATRHQFHIARVSNVTVCTHNWGAVRREGAK